MDRKSRSREWRFVTGEGLTRRRFLVTTISGAGAIALLGACLTTPVAAAAATAGTESPAFWASQSSGSSFTYGAWQDFDTPDVNISSLAATGRLGQQIWDPLIRMVSGDSNLHPGLAARWDADPAATWFTLYL